MLVRKQIYLLAIRATQTKSNACPLPQLHLTFGVALFPSAKAETLTTIVTLLSEKKQQLKGRRSRLARCTVPYDLCGEWWQVGGERTIELAYG